MASISVVSMGGNKLCTLHLERTDTLQILAKEAALMLGALNCSLISARGIQLAMNATIEENSLEDGDIVTAVASGTAPCLMSSAFAFAAGSRYTAMYTVAVLTIARNSQDCPRRR